MKKQLQLRNRDQIENIIGILPDSYIYSFCKWHNLISDYNINNIEAASYDLTIEEFCNWELNTDGDDTITKTTNSILLKPNQFTFIKSKEKINMPNHMIGRVVLRNRFIRAGLVATAPLFQPGDKGSHVFVCIRNLSNYDIRLTKEDSIVQMYFEILCGVPDHPYDSDTDSSFRQNVAFKIPVSTIQNNIVESDNVEKTINNFEARIYTMVATFVGAFVAILAIIMVNFVNANFGKKSIKDIVITNISLAFCIIVILGIVMLFTYKITTAKSKGEKPHN